MLSTRVCSGALRARRRSPSTASASIIARNTYSDSVCDRSTVQLILYYNNVHELIYTSTVQSLTIKEIILINSLADFIVQAAVVYWTEQCTPYGLQYALILCSAGGETIGIAREEAAREALKRLFATDDARSPLPLDSPPPREDRASDSSPPLATAPNPNALDFKLPPPDTRVRPHFPDGSSDSSTNREQLH